MRTLDCGKEKLIICINKSSKEETVLLNNTGELKLGKEIYSGKGCRISDNKLTMSPEGILVIRL